MRSLMMGLEPGSPCSTCRHLRPDGYTKPSARRVLDAGVFACDAFPRGIPDAVTSGQHDHRTALRGDHGIRYEAGEPRDDDRFGWDEEEARLALLGHAMAVPWVPADCSVCGAPVGTVGGKVVQHGTCAGSGAPPK